MRPYKCGQCGFLTVEISDLHEHLIAHCDCVGYFFHFNHKTAYPKLQNYDITTQTEDKICIEAQWISECPEIKTEVSTFDDNDWEDENTVDHQDFGDISNTDNIDVSVGFNQGSIFQNKGDSVFAGCSDATHSVEDKYSSSVDFNDWSSVQQIPGVDDNFMQRLKKKEGSNVKLMKKKSSNEEKPDSAVDSPNKRNTSGSRSASKKKVNDDSIDKKNQQKPLGTLYKIEFDENDIEVHTCTICSFRCESKDQIIVHLSEHCVQNSQICEVCGHAVANKQALSNHKKNFCGRKHECHICGAIFRRPSRLIDHLRVHSGECPWVCDQCGKAFRTNPQLNKHLKCVHSSVRNYQCTQCEKSFKIPWLLRKHERTHNQILPYTCQFCGKRFTSKWNMKAHMRRHTGEKPYQCANCGECFAHNVVRKSHQAKCFSAPSVDNI
ncbi:Zinc finger E-box-binding homeobox 2 [Mactra antiquata]